MTSMTRRNVTGILLLDKPYGLTSNQALQRVKYLFHAKKAGHTGSLDPIATGMLPLCFGDATKFAQFLLNSDKSYYVVVKLGEETSTGDTEGEIISRKSVEDVTLEKIESVLPRFLGEIEQIPPMYSAIKHQGKPLYKLARMGINVPRTPRKIQIFSLKLDSFDSPEMVLRVHCSKGTYIRTLVEEIGNALGCGAHVSQLRRTAISPYLSETSIMYTVDDLEKKIKDEGIASLDTFLLDIESSLNAFPAVKLSTAAAFYLKMGQPVRASFPLDSSLVRLISANSEFIGIGEVLADGRVKPHRLLSS